MKYIKTLYCNIKNLIIWFPVIWRDRDYDHYYFLRILEFKLVKMSRYFKTSNIAESDLENHEKIEELLVILRRMIEDDYNQEGHEAHDLK